MSLKHVEDRFDKKGNFTELFFASWFDWMSNSILLVHKYIDSFVYWNIKVVINFSRTKT